MAGLVTDFWQEFPGAPQPGSKGAIWYGKKVAREKKTRAAEAARELEVEEALARHHEKVKGTLFWRAVGDTLPVRKASGSPTSQLDFPEAVAALPPDDLGECDSDGGHDAA